MEDVRVLSLHYRKLTAIKHKGEYLNEFNDFGYSASIQKYLMIKGY